MATQHLQDAKPSRSFANTELQEFIVQNLNTRERRTGLGVKLVDQGYLLYEEIQRIIGLSLGSITGWKQASKENGIDGLKLNYLSFKTDV